MEAVEIQTSITLARVAQATVPMGVAVERYDAVGGVKRYGGEIVSRCNTIWTAVGSNVTCSVQTAAFDIFEETTPQMARLDASASTGCPATTVLAYTTIPDTDFSKDSYIYALVRSDVATSAGDLQIGVDETASFAGPDYTDIPALVAGAWTFVQVAMPATGLDADHIVHVGIYNANSSPYDAVLDIQYIGRGNNVYGIAGIATNDMIDYNGDETEEYEKYNDITVLAAGHINADLLKGVTCVAEQPLYVVPYSGKLATTEITDNNRVITATEDQTTAGGQVGVRL